jgi:hypothetical protein
VRRAASGTRIRAEEGTRAAQLEGEPTPAAVTASRTISAGFALFAREQSHTLDYVTMMLPSMIFLGLGWGFGYPALNVRATGGVADREQGLAAGLFNTGLQIGGAIGVAIASAIITSHIASAGPTEGIIQSIRPTMVIVIPVALVGAAVILAADAIHRRSPLGQLEPPA